MQDKKMATIAVKQEFDNSHEPAPGCSTACSPTDDNVDTRPTVCFIKEETHDEEEVQECLEDPDFSPVKTGMKVWPSNRRQYGPARKATKIKIENLDDGFEGSELATNESSSQNLSKGPQMATVEQELGVGTTIGSGAGTASVKQENNSCQEPTPGCSTAVSTIKNDDHDDDDNVNDDSDQQRTGSLCLELFTDEAQVEQEAAERVEDMELARVNSGMIMWVSNCIQYAPAKAKKMATVAVKEKDSSQEPTPGCSTACSPINDDDDTQRTGLLSLEIFEEEAHDLQEAAGSSEEVECSSAKSEPVMCPPPCSTSHQSNATQVAELDSNKTHSINQPNNSHAKKAMLYRCAHCSYETRQLQYLKNHIAKKHAGEKLSKCVFCNYKSSNLVDLKRHLKMHSGEKLSSCKIRDYKTAQLFKLLKQVSYKATVTHQLQDMQNHVPKHAGKKLHICEFCDFKCTQSSRMKRHIRTHTGGKPFICELCGKKYSSLSALKNHIPIHAQYSCKICDYKCSNPKNMEIHMRKHTGEKPFNCELCDYKCSYQRYLVEHLKKHRPTSNSYICEFCGHICPRLAKLRIHLRSHTHEKPFSCKLCDFNCKDSSALRNHLKVHSDSKPFSCELCDFKAFRFGHLKSHLRVHTGEKPYSCKLCDYKFNRSSHLTHHMRTHTGEKPYSCKLCDFRCAQIGSIQYHFRKHHEDEDYSKLYDYKPDTN
ncbi:zinc finger protein 2 homolog isoform X3 [Nilaparvata lugens]|uniref:zinc finger protein 2 homolog isoform X3 n=1 Tax=Nilaparvata lugens TaxID=108931 RepID=UPI00193EB22D|nr:zinc finger protein 2 homolog isoform X3 [Nilaparvata lugens]